MDQLLILPKPIAVILNADSVEKMKTLLDCLANIT